LFAYDHGGPLRNVGKLLVMILTIKNIMVNSLMESQEYVQCFEEQIFEANK